jgi:Serine carboxypeptidase
VAFLHAFVQRFPAYQGRPFWISGESYGAHSASNQPLLVCTHARHTSGPVWACEYEYDPRRLDVLGLHQDPAATAAFLSSSFLSVWLDFLFLILER